MDCRDQRRTYSSVHYCTTSRLRADSDSWSIGRLRFTPQPFYFCIYLGLFSLPTLAVKSMYVDVSVCALMTKIYGTIHATGCILPMFPKVLYFENLQDSFSLQHPFVWKICLQWFLAALAVRQVVSQQEQQDAVVLQALLPSVSVLSVEGSFGFCPYMRTER